MIRFVALAALLLAPLARAETPTVRVGLQEGGTVAWEMDVIETHGLDRAAGVDVVATPLAGKSAADIALLGGAVDAVVTDWLWVARQRAEGRDFVFIPYSKAVGALLVPADSPVASLADLKGRTVGVAGGPLDKSWLILQALARQRHGIDLAAETEAVFGAPPLVHQQALAGELDAAINFWHFAAKLEARGFRPVATVAEAAAELGLDPDTPLLGYALPGGFVRANPEAARGLAAASRAAKARLAADDAEWDRLRPMMRAEEDRDFEALKAGFRAGIPAPGPVDAAAAARLYALMAELGGAELVGPSPTLPEGVFLDVPEG
jgi:NitT/TauT family transport system substrate-binding protein